MTTHLTHADLKGPDRAAKAPPDTRRAPARYEMPLPVRRRKASQPEVIVQIQGQRPQLPDASEATETEPASQVRRLFPERWAIQTIFREAKRRRA